MRTQKILSFRFGFMGMGMGMGMDLGLKHNVWIFILDSCQWPKSFVNIT